MAQSQNPQQAPLPPTTTTQEDLTKAGQRRVNLIWEYTQAAIAITVVFCTMGAGLYLAIHPGMEQIPTVMSMAFGTVVGFYFARTNHSTVGGIGPKPAIQPYEGR